MRTHVALLRGVNVGGHNRVAMAALRGLVADLGHTDVATYIQSGNVVFTAAEPAAAPAALAAGLEQALAQRLAVPAGVVVLTRAELAAVVAANPFPEVTDPKRLHAAFRAADLTPADVEAVAAAQRWADARGGHDEARIVGRTLYLHTPDGLGRSELAQRLSRPGPVTVTVRNWATVTRLLVLCTDPAPVG